MYFITNQKGNGKYSQKRNHFKNERKANIFKKQLTAVILCVITCLNIISPAYAALPDTLTERTNEYTVKIRQGDGKILMNKDSAVRTYTNSHVSYTVNYIDAAPNDFDEISGIELAVREGETVKNRLDYSKTRANIADGNAYDWINEAFITSTRAVRSILENGLNTYIYNSPDGQSGKDTAEALAGSLSGTIYPRNVTKAYLFVPDSETFVFSHFIDQHGNIFDLSSYVTEDLVLTPVYTQASEALPDTFFNSKVHQVTILPGEGRIQKFTGDEDYYNRDPQRYTGDENFEDLEKITFIVKDGDAQMTDIATPYARLKWGDMEKAEIFLKENRNVFLQYIENGQGKEAVLSLKEMIEVATNDMWWTSSMNITSTNENFQATREYGYSLLFLLFSWVEVCGDGKTSPESLNALLAEAENYDNLSDDEQEVLLDNAKTTVNAFTAAWNAFCQREYENSASWYHFYTDVQINGLRYNESISEAKDSLAVQKGILRIRTPDSEYSYYNFDHFVDQDGNIFNFGDPVTKDLVLTPVFTDWRESKYSTIAGNITVTTEDNSDESFAVKLTQQTSDFSKFENKDNYTFDETLWDIDENGKITNYKGGLGLIGIPETINGITVSSLSNDAFRQLYVDNLLNDDYSGSDCAVWIPKTLINIEIGSVSKHLKTTLDELFSNIDEDAGFPENISEYFDINTTGKDDSTALVFLPTSYIVVDKDNPGYSSLRGSLYNKNKTDLLYVSLDANNHSNQNAKEILGHFVPSTVEEISAFATYRGMTDARNYFTNCYSPKLKINTCITKADGDVKAIVNAFTQAGTLMTEEDVQQMISEINDTRNGFFHVYNIFSGIYKGGVAVLPESESTATDGIRNAFFEMYKAYYPDASDSEIAEQVEYALLRFTIQSGGLKDYADRTGHTAKDRPYQPTFIQAKGENGYYYGDTFSYAVELINIPERYKPVEVQYIHPNQTQWNSEFDEEPIPNLDVAFHLELKRGNVNITSADAETGATINATYIITDAADNIIDTVDSTVEAAAVISALPYGTYKVAQKTVGTGYSIAEPQTFSIIEDGQTVNVKFENRMGCRYSVRVPKSIILDGATGMGEYKVGVSGILGQNMQIHIFPSATFTLSQNGKNDIIASVLQDKTEWIAADMSTDSWNTATGNISAPLTAGTWKGSIGFTITIE